MGGGGGGGGGREGGETRKREGIFLINDLIHN